jgi:hypothetical protein
MDIVHLICTDGHYQNQWHKQASIISPVHQAMTGPCASHAMFVWYVGNQQMNHGEPSLFAMHALNDFNLTAIC